MSHHATQQTRSSCKKILTTLSPLVANRCHNLSNCSNTNLYKNNCQFGMQEIYDKQFGS
jgi:hypothetical protein